MGARPARIIGRHLLPSFMSHLIASATLIIPGMILGETALSFLGLGLRPPITSWGVLLNEAQNISVVALYPWLMLPVRSEEHTSELQSRQYLVCRLLLEKKKHRFVEYLLTLRAV